MRIGVVTGVTAATDTVTLLLMTILSAIGEVESTESRFEGGISGSGIVDFRGFVDRRSHVMEEDDIWILSCARVDWRGEGVGRGVRSLIQQQFKVHPHSSDIVGIWTWLCNLSSDCFQMC